MSELPKGWLSIRAEEVCEKVQSGSTPRNSPFTESGDIPYLKVYNIVNQKIAFDYKKQFISNDIHEEKLVRSRVLPNDVLMNIVGPPLGKVAIVGSEYPEWNINQAITLFRTNNEYLLNKFLYYFLREGSSIKAIHGDLKGSVGQVNISLSQCRNFSVPLPPMAEQKRIVEKLDEVLAQVDTIKARLDGIPDLLKRFRQSVLASAVSGKLTEEWRGDAEIVNWKDGSIGDVAVVATGKTPKRTNNDYWDSSDVPWLTSSATGSLYCNEAEQFVSEFAVEDCKLKKFPKGTLLLAMYGEGKTRGQVTELTFEATCNQACAAISVKNDLALNQYVKLRLLENYEETRKAASGGNQPNLNLNKVREIPIRLPEMEEQKEIVRLVDQYFSFADTIEAQVKKAQQRVDNLTQSILAKAFRGELVPQDPNDESADKLLERIAKARAEAEALAKATKKAGAAKKRAAKA